ncbi:MAG: hypothetical protein ACPG9K_04180 [Poseidonibacter sp.]
MFIILIGTSLLANNYKFKKLEEEKTELINKYEIRVEIARLDRFYKRVKVLNRTLHCFKQSRSKREITACKIDENRRIMQLLKKG